MALPGTAGGAQEESDDAGGADPGAAARRDGGVTPGTALVALRTGLVFGISPTGAETRLPLAQHPDTGHFWACGPGGFPDRLSPGPWTPSAPSSAAPPAGGLSLPRREQGGLCSCALSRGLFPAAAGVLVQRRIARKGSWPFQHALQLRGLAFREAPKNPNEEASL